jgi:hypothetical protein
LPLLKLFKSYSKEIFALIDQYIKEEKLKEGVKMSEMNESYPSNVSQAVQLLLYYLPFKDKVEVAIKTESELVKLQNSLGKYIQTEFSLDSNASLIESCLARSDNGEINSKDASQIIIKEFWKQLKAN